jgi:hypothetical protein
MTSLADSFIAEIETFLDKTKMSPSAFGKAAVNDPNFVSDVREGRAPSLRLADRVREFMRTESAA